MPFRGTLAAAMEYISAQSGGRDMLLVLKAIGFENDGLAAYVSDDLHRVDVSLRNGMLAGVRVTAPRRRGTSAAPMLRFKPPRNTEDFEVLYFGGVGANGLPVIHKVNPRHIGEKQTITVRCGV